MIFLDVDGVICPYPEWQCDWANNQNGELSAQCCRYLKDVLDATGAKIVLTSSWRLDAESLNDLYTQLAQYGITRDHIAGTTQNFANRKDIQSHNHLRWLEIKDYIDTHKVDKYVILDDFNLTKYDKDHLVRTKMHIGLTDKLKDVAVRKLR